MLNLNGFKCKQPPVVRGSHIGQRRSGPGSINGSADGAQAGCNEDNAHLRFVFSGCIELCSGKCLYSWKNNKASETPKATVLPSLGRHVKARWSL